MLFRTSTQVLLFSLLGIAFLLRWICSQGEFWLDEIWTWDIVGSVSGPFGVFYQLQDENNHYLNSLVVRCLKEGWWGGETWWGWYRLPAVICGTAAVGVAWSLGRSPQSRGDTAGWLAAGLTATSYLLVHYSSEARGYSYAVFFAALAFHELQLVLEYKCRSLVDGSLAVPTRRTRAAVWLFPLACCGGFLSQSIFLTCFGALALWAALRLKRKVSPEQVLPLLVSMFFPPGLFFVLLYVLDLRHAANGGGNVFPLWQVLIETLSLTGGGPFSGWVAIVVAGLVLGGFIQGLWVQAQSNDDRWIFHLLVVVVMPLGLLIVLRRAEVYPRYFIVAVFFLIQAAARGLSDLLQRGRVPWVLATVTIAAVMWGNGRHVQRLVSLGRGSYLPVLRLMLKDEHSETVLVRGDQDFRHALMFKYWLRLTDSPGKRIQYVNLDQIPDTGVPWLITHSLDVQWRPTQTRTVKGIEYKLQLFRPYAGLSGWGLALYRRNEKGAVTALE